MEKPNKNRTPVKTPKKGQNDHFSAMDVAVDNRIVLGYGSDINFIAPDKDNVVTGWTPKHKNNSIFSPRQILLQDESKKTFALSPMHKNALNVFDTETGKVLAEFNVKNTLADIDMPLDVITTDQKFSQLHTLPNQVFDNVALSGNMVFNVKHDLRVKPEDIVITNKAEVKTKGLGFTCVATSPQGDVAVGTTAGEIKLYSNPSKDGWHQAKTNVTQLIQPVEAVDISHDSHWVLWTTKEFIALINVTYNDKSGHLVTGFHHKIPADERKSVMILKLTDEEKDAMKIREVHFTPAKFDAATASGAKNLMEGFIVTSTGSFIVTWNFRQLVNDYKKLNKGGDHRLETVVRPKITTMDNPVLATAFEWGHSNDAVVVAATNDALSRMALD